MSHSISTACNIEKSHRNYHPLRIVLLYISDSFHVHLQYDGGYTVNIVICGAGGLSMMPPNQGHARTFSAPSLVRHGSILLARNARTQDICRNLNRVPQVFARRHGTLVLMMPLDVRYLAGCRLYKTTYGVTTHRCLQSWLAGEDARSNASKFLAEEGMTTPQSHPRHPTTLYLHLVLMTP